MPSLLPKNLEDHKSKDVELSIRDKYNTPYNAKHSTQQGIRKSILNEIKSQN